MLEVASEICSAFEQLNRMQSNYNTYEEIGFL